MQRVTGAALARPGWLEIDLLGHCLAVVRDEPALDGRPPKYKPRSVLNSRAVSCQGPMELGNAGGTRSLFAALGTLYAMLSVAAKH